MSYTIVDRRTNPNGKNLTNRQRFLKRAKEQVKKSVEEGLSDRGITSDEDQQITIPSKGINEPSFGHDSSTGDTDYVLPGNKEYMPGDLIERPKKSKGGGSKGSPDGEGDDDFGFVISREEYLDILFEDLELPDLNKTSMKQIETFQIHRSGFTNVGSPANLDIVGTLKKSMGRRIALKKPSLHKIKELEEQIATEKNKTKKAKLEEKLIILKRKTKAIPFVDPIDLRYRNFEKRPDPKHQAVMFCVMDVSASMGVKEKDLAKRFYMLLYRFLQRQYEKVEVVFIRHHSIASECTEAEFFYSKETGGTVVSEGFKLLSKIQKDRYPENEWNLYCAQASDGDNFSSDNADLTKILTDDILPMLQYLAYIEVGGTDDSRGLQTAISYDYGLWPVYRPIAEAHPHFEMKRIQNKTQIYNVFRELFSKEKESK